MDVWIIKIGCAVVFFGLHAIFSHHSDLGETYECDRRWDRAYGNFEFNAFAWLLFLGIAGLALYCMWSALPASQPVAKLATARVVCTKRPAAKSTIATAVGAGRVHGARGTHAAQASKATNARATHGNATHANAKQGGATHVNAKQGCATQANAKQGCATHVNAKHGCATHANAKQGCATHANAKHVNAEPGKRDARQGLHVIATNANAKQANTTRD